jgi:3-hydroxybutyrate dehydrogenase
MYPSLSYRLSWNVWAQTDIQKPWSNFWHPPGSPPSKDEPSSSRYAVLDINITHPIRVTQLAIKHFLSLKRPGVVVHISSVAGQTPFFPTPVYVATKHAISGFVRSLSRLENPPMSSNLPKIRVNAVSPARILTPLWTDNPDKMKFVPQERADWVTPDDVADVMLELVERSDYVGGTVIEVGVKVRKVEILNDGGPVSVGNQVVADEHAEDASWESLMAMYGKQ